MYKILLHFVVNHSLSQPIKEKVELVRCSETSFASVTVLKTIPLRARRLVHHRPRARQGYKRTPRTEGLSTAYDIPPPPMVASTRAVQAPFMKLLR